MILVTGVSGFIGKHLLTALVKEYGANYILALTSRPVSMCPYLLHDDYSFDSNAFVKAGYDSINTIIHAGAFTPKSRLQANDWEKCNGNISNTEALLKAVLPSLKTVVFLSTIDVYAQDDLLTEQSRLEPISLYGHSKLYGEKMIGAWAASNHKACQVLRVGHVYGPGEEAYQKVIPITMQKLLRNQKLQILGSGNEKRSFIFIKDIIDAILNSLKLNKTVGEINLVSGHSISIKELLEKLVRISGVRTSIEVVSTDSVGRDLVFDNSKMRNELLPLETPLDEGLTIEWQYMKQLKV